MGTIAAGVLALLLVVGTVAGIVSATSGSTDRKVPTSAVAAYGSR